MIATIKNVADHPKTWGEALGDHLAAIGLRDNEAIAEAFGRDKSTIIDWLSRETCPRLHKSSKGVIMDVLGLPRASDVDRLEEIEPGTAVATNIIWDRVDPSEIPPEKAIFALWSAGVPTDLLDQVRRAVDDLRRQGQDRGPASSAHEGTSTTTIDHRETRAS